MLYADADWEAHPLKTIVATYRAPSFAVNPHNGDEYSAYNKPAAVVDWLQHIDVSWELQPAHGTLFCSSCVLLCNSNAYIGVSDHSQEL